MTVTTTLDRQYFPGDGANKNFPFNFKFFDNSQIYVFLISPDGSALGRTLNVDYTLSGALSTGGGQVTMVVAPPLNYRLFVQRILSPTQPTSIRNQGAFFPAIHEDVFDRLTMLIQQSLSNDSIALQLDQSGTTWDFKGHRGVNAADPINPQDVTTKNWVSLLIDTVTGAINNVTGIIYDAGTLFDFLRFSNERVVDSVAALRLLSGSRNQRAKTAGYYKKGDGGHASFYIDTLDTTSADNGVTIIVSSVDGSRWKMLYDGDISLQAAGLKGDGKRVYFSLTAASGATQIQVPGASFTSDDVGKVFSLCYTLGVFRTTITGIVNSTTVLIGTPFPATVSALNCLLTYGTNDTAALQNAVTSLQSKNINFTMGPNTYVLTSQINGSGGFKITGVGCEPYVAVDTWPKMGGGSWMHLAHSGKGFSLLPPASGFGSGVRFELFGTYRDQPLRGTGWAPVVTDYDFYQENIDVHLERMVALNPYRLLIITNAGTGRLTINGLQHQALSMGLNLDFTTDLCRIQNVHDWPYWDAGPILAGWMCKNKTSLRTARADNTFIDNYFSIYAKDGWLVDGPSYGIQVGTIDLDGNQYGIRSTANASGSDIRIANLITQCEPTYANPGSSILLDAGSNMGISISNHFCGLSGNAAIRQLSGAGSRINISQGEYRNWNNTNTGYSVFETATDCSLDITKYRLVPGTFGSLGNVFSGTTLVTAPLQKGSVVQSTDASGNILISHNSGAIPKFVDLQSLTNSGLVLTTDKTTWSNSGFIVKAWSASGTPAASVSVSLQWRTSL